MGIASHRSRLDLEGRLGKEEVELGFGGLAVGQLVLNLELVVGDSASLQPPKEYWVKLERFLWMQNPPTEHQEESQQAVLWVSMEGLGEDRLMALEVVPHG